MSEPHIDYFKSKEHEKLCMSHIETERQRVYDILEKDGVLPAISLCVSMLAAYPSFMKSLGLKTTAVTLLKDALKEVEK